MAIPFDDGTSAYYWSEDGHLIERETGLPVLRNGQPIVWVEPEPDPNEDLPYDGPTIWAVTAYRLDLPPETAVTIWVVKPTLEEAIALFEDTAGAGMDALAINPWEPKSLAQHLRWLNGVEGNLAAIIERSED